MSTSVDLFHSDKGKDKVEGSTVGAILYVNALNSCVIYSGERYSPVWGPLYNAGMYQLIVPNGSSVVAGTSLGASSGTLPGAFSMVTLPVGTLEVSGAELPSNRVAPLGHHEYTGTGGGGGGAGGFGGKGGSGGGLSVLSGVDQLWWNTCLYVHLLEKCPKRPQL
jgi:hypothetical protein